MADTESPRLVVEAGRHAGEKAELNEGTALIGRSSKCALVLNRTSGVSRQHAQIVYRLGTYSVMDLDSRNGTFVNGEEVIGRYPLNNNDVIEISEERILYFGPSGRAVTKTSSSKKAAMAAPKMGKDEAPKPRRQKGAKPSGERQNPTEPPMPPPDAAPVAEHMNTGEFKRIPRTDEFVVKEITNPVGPPPMPNLAPALPQESHAALPKHKEAPPLPIGTSKELSSEGAPIDSPRHTKEPAKKGSLFLWLALMLIVPLLLFFALDFGLNEGKLTRSLSGSQESSTDDETLAAKELAAKELAAKELAAKELANKDLSAKELAAKELAAKELAAKELAAKELAAKELAAKELAAKELAAKELAAKTPTGAQEATATISGEVTTIARLGTRVKSGQSVALVVGTAQNAISERKLRTLKREERSFAKAAAQGNARAQQELRSIRRDIAKAERRTEARRTIRAPISGTVTKVLKSKGSSVRRGQALLVIEAD